MPKFQAFIHGVNFHMRDVDSSGITSMGFYVTAYVDAVSPEAAEYASVDILRATPKLREAVLNPPDDPPQIFVDEIQELTELPTECVMPLSGFVFYKDTGEKEDNASTPENA